MNRSRLTSAVRVFGAGLFAFSLWTGSIGQAQQQTNQKTAGASSNAPATPAGSFWGEWPANADPKAAGRKVVSNLIARPVIETRNYGMIYPEVCVSYGALRFVGQTHDAELLAQLVTRYQGMLNPPGERSPFPHNAPAGGGGGGGGAARGPARGRGGRAGAATAPATQSTADATTQPAQPAAARAGRGNRGAAAAPTPQGVDPKAATAITLVPQADHVDASVFGALPIELFKQTGDRRYLDIGLKSANDEWAVIDVSRMPEPAKSVAVDAMTHGLTPQTRWWIDDMFMIPAVQVQAYRGTRDKEYLDRCARAVSAYLDKLQKDNGLFYHADDVPAYWGRGVGWVAAGLTELLSDLPPEHPQYTRIMDGYKKLMAGLLKYQASDGMWRQLIDHADSWAETSSSGMFTFAMGTGVKKGWLPAAEYKEAARKAWIALSGYLDENGNVRDVCVGTNKYGNMANAPEGMVAYYYDRGRNVGDLHGQAAFIWASWAMLD